MEIIGIFWCRACQRINRS